MEASQKLSFFSIWTNPRGAFRFFLAQQSVKIEHVFLLIASVPMALYCATTLPMRPAVAVPLAVVCQYLFTWIASFFYAWFYTVIAKWFNGQGNVKKNRMVFLLTNVSLLPVLGIVILLSILLKQPSSIALNSTAVILGLVYIAAAVHLVTLQLRYASEANQFSKVRAFFASLLVSLIPAAVVVGLTYLLIFVKQVW